LIPGWDVIANVFGRERTMFTTRLQCENGDVKLGWDDVTDSRIREIIEKKLKEGYHFFRESEADPDVHVRIRRVGDVGKHVIIPDEDLQALFNEGKIAIVQTDTYDSAMSAGPERVREATAVMETNTVAHRPLSRG
jgi:hypothetical protein